MKLEKSINRVKIKVAFLQRWIYIYDKILQNLWKFNENERSIHI